MPQGNVGRIVLPIVQRVTIVSLCVVLACVLLLVAYVGLSALGVINLDVWHRPTPLVNATAVASVRDGDVVLADGRKFRPAGVLRREGVGADEFDLALRIATAQGVIVERDLGDGSAMLRGEPKFHKSGSRVDFPGPNTLGWYRPCSVSEILLFTGYAKVDTKQTGVLPQELRRLNGVVDVFWSISQPELRFVRKSSMSFQTSDERALCDNELFEYLIDDAATKKSR